MNEYEETHLDLLLKIDELKATSRRENTNTLELMKALECKKRLDNLKDDCAAETYIDVAHAAAMSIKNVAKGMSPGSSQRLLAASFTPSQSRLKDYVIPRQLPPDSLRSEISPSSTWHSTNFPDRSD